MMSNGQTMPRAGSQHVGKVGAGVGVGNPAHGSDWQALHWPVDGSNCAAGHHDRGSATCPMRANVQHRLWLVSLKACPLQPVETL